MAASRSLWVALGASTSTPACSTVRNDGSAFFAFGGRSSIATFSSITRSRRRKRRKARTADSLRAIVDGSFRSNNEAR